MVGARDAAARPIRAAARSAAAAVADARARAFADARARSRCRRPRRCPGPGCSPPVRSASRTPACSFWFGRSAHDRRHDRRHRVGLGDRRRRFDRPLDRANFGDRPWRPRRARGRPPDDAFHGHRALQRARALQRPAAAGAGWRSPPPPPPPPGPGLTRNTSRAGCSAPARPWPDSSCPRPSAARRRRPACRRPEAVSGPPRPPAGCRAWAEELTRRCRSGLQSAQQQHGAHRFLGRRRTRRRATRSTPDASSASASPIEAPAARAISRAVKTSVHDWGGGWPWLYPAAWGKRLAVDRGRGVSGPPSFSAFLRDDLLGQPEGGVLVVGQRGRTIELTGRLATFGLRRASPSSGLRPLC